MSQDTNGNMDSTQLLGIDDTKEVISFRKCQLVPLEGPDKGKKFDLSKSSLKVGKKDNCDIILTDKTVSRNHFEIIRHQDNFLLRDLESTNGTFINDIRVREAFLTPGDVIKIGKSRLEFIAFDENVQIEPSQHDVFGEAVGQSRKMRQIFGILERIAPTNATVIIEGETGTGKEVIARAIHEHSLRKGKPFIVFDCGAVAENLIESELFGHVKGAFTGAVQTRRGAFEESHTGTIFLDEIGELTLDLQPKLLRALEQRQIKKVGSTASADIDVRVISATNRNLKKEVANNTFREDLYYRLSVVKIILPPLRERPEDVPLLIERVLSSAKFNQLPDGKLRVTKIDDEAQKALQRYQWPGNVRELINVLERTIPLVDDGVIKGQHVKYVFQTLDSDDEATERMDVDMELPFKEAKQKLVESFEKDYLTSLLKQNNYNISKTAREAGIDRKHIRNLLKKYGILDRVTDDES
jgi:transcriptional regulator with GAF, ATPase, and Fis domain